MAAYDPHERIAGNTAINQSIHEILAATSELSRLRMLKTIRQRRDAALRHGTPGTDKEALHIYREFIAGFHLNQHGFDLEYGPKLGTQTPDWFDHSERLLLEGWTCELGKYPKRRIATNVTDKCLKYEKLIATESAKLVVSIHAVFDSFVDVHDCESAIHDHALFEIHDLSGIIFFAESNVVHRPDGTRKQLYDFTYFPNPNAARPIDLSHVCNRMMT